MSSIIRRRSGLIVAIWGSCPERGRCENPHLLRQGPSPQPPRLHSRLAGSFNAHPCSLEGARTSGTDAPRAWGRIAKSKYGADRAMPPLSRTGAPLALNTGSRTARARVSSNWSAVASQSCGRHCCGISSVAGHHRPDASCILHFRMNHICILQSSLPTCACPWHANVLILIINRQAVIWHKTCGPEVRIAYLAPRPAHFLHEIVNYAANFDL